MTQPDPRFTWVDFFEQFADRLLHDYRNRRGPLISAVQTALSAVKSNARFDEEDICPFTVMALVNRGNSKWSNRTSIVESLNHSLDMELDPPADFHGVPVLQAQQWWFFDYASGRQDGDIDSLWQLFEDALALGQTDDDDTRAAFAASFDAALQVKKTGIKSLTMGLYWMRPNRFVALDENNTQYIRRHFRDVRIYGGTPKGAEYLELCDEISSSFPITVNNTVVSSFPQLSYEAWESRKSMDELVKEAQQNLEESDEYNDPDSPEARREDAKASARRQGQPKFRRRLLKVYGRRCAITGYTAKGDAESVLEACHIRTYPGQNRDWNSVSNGLLLRADIHTLFDRGLIGIDPTTWKVKIRQELQRTQYKDLAGKRVALPDNPTDWPDAELLQLHWKNKGRW